MWVSFDVQMPFRRALETYSELLGLEEGCGRIGRERSQNQAGSLRRKRAGNQGRGKGGLEPHPRSRDAAGIQACGDP